jgi:hypothetical protein
MEFFEERALETATPNPVCRLRYVDDTFFIWPLVPGKLADFVDHLNSVHGNIHFTVETGKNGRL